MFRENHTSEILFVVANRDRPICTTPIHPSRSTSYSVLYKLNHSVRSYCNINYPGTTPIWLLLNSPFDGSKHSQSINYDLFLLLLLLLLVLREGQKTPISSENVLPNTVYLLLRSHENWGRNSMSSDGEDLLGLQSSHQPRSGDFGGALPEQLQGPPRLDYRMEVLRL
ncbi:MAG: hypothetical protein M1840_000447 [Geoglossum simile]|nr:MAG: hypothetical protein M1840_000447 [Geoglossum simile]